MKPKDVGQGQNKRQASYLNELLNEGGDDTET